MFTSRVEPAPPPEATALCRYGLRSSAKILAQPFWTIWATHRLKIRLPCLAQWISAAARVRLVTHPAAVPAGFVKLFLASLRCHFLMSSRHLTQRLSHFSV